MSPVAPKDRLIDGRMTVKVTDVFLPEGSTIGHGYGRDEDGRFVHFVGDRRMMQTIADALDKESVVPAEVQGHQLLAYIGVPGPWRWEDQ